MQEKPLISIIVPVYNVEAYLDRCIRSLVEQTYENLEILLVDDGSPDESGAICDRWAEKDSRIRVIHKENGGAGMARNVALDAARGELIGFVDSDDYIAPRMYAHLYHLMGETCDIAECEVVFTEADDCPLDDGSSCETTDASAVEAMAMHLQEKMFCQTPPNKLYRRSVIGDIRFPEGNLIDDEFFTYKVIGNARRLMHSSACLYAYRQQPGSVMHRPYSLRRLQGLEAQRQRLDYVKARMPELTYQARLHLFFQCIYARQMSMLWMTGEELETAKKIIRSTVSEVTPLMPRRENGLSRNLWLILAQISFDGVCRLQNKLESRKS